MDKPQRPIRNTQDYTIPKTIEQLVKKYDLDNVKIYDFLDSLVEEYNNKINDLIKSKEIVADSLTSNSAIDALSAKQGKILADMINKSIICAYPDIGEHNITADNQIVDLDLSDTVGTKFTLENNTIKVGTGVSKVLISGTIYFLDFSTAQGGYILPAIIKNATNVTSAIEPIVTNGASTQSVVFSEILIDVQEGDIFKMSVGYMGAKSKGRYIGKDSGGSIRTYITVKEVS